MHLDLAEDHLLRVPTVGECSHHEVTVGNDPANSVVLAGDHVADVEFAHEQRGVDDRGIRAERRRIRSHHPQRLGP